MNGEGRRARQYSVIDDLLENAVFRRYFPLAGGAVFLALFVSLGMWQLDRADQKKALLAQYRIEGPYTRPADLAKLHEFDRIEVFGHYLGDRQVLIDNIPMEGRLGYFVITPFKTSTGEPPLLVNRGWVAREAPNAATPAADLGIDAEYRTIRGIVSHLPRVGLRPGEAFEGERGWPRVAVFPSNEEIAAELGEPVLPGALLLSPEAEDGFLRHWEPDVSGPSMHYSYAFQWFALAVAVVVIVTWQMRKRLGRGPT